MKFKTICPYRGTAHIEEGEVLASAEALARHFAGEKISEEEHFAAQALLSPLQRGFLPERKSP